MLNLRVWLVGLSLFMAGCDGAPTASAPPVSKTAETQTASPSLRGALRLTKAERDSHIKACRSGVLQLNTRVITSAVIAAARSEIATACDCLVNQIEDRTNKLQFTMIMAAIKEMRGSNSQKRFPGDLPAVRQAATQSGITPVEYRDAFAEVPNIIEAVVEYCKDK
jgi:hypothetical protein